MSSRLAHAAPSTVVSGRRPGTRRATGLAGALVALLGITVASLVFGTRDVDLGDVVAGLGGTPDTIAQAAVARRVPRTMLALIVGAALGMSGAVMQGVTRNPLADPHLFGVMPGAALAVVTGIAFFGLASPRSYAWVAIVGAAVAAFVVYAIGSLGGGSATPLRLALAGAVVTAAASSLVSAILLPRIQVMDSFRFWQIGGVGGANAQTLLQVCPFLLAGSVLCLACAPGLDALALGDDLAAGLGHDVLRARILSGVAAVTLCGSATAAAGPIGFVGLVVPHACRIVAGHEHRWLLPYCAVVGAALLTLADVVGRVVARPDEVEVGIITALIGAPVFIAIVRRTGARSL